MLKLVPLLFQLLDRLLENNSSQNHRQLEEWNSFDQLQALDYQPLAKLSNNACIVSEFFKNVSLISDFLFFNSELQAKISIAISVR